MPTPEFRLPDDFPDLSLPDRSDKSPEPFPPMARTPASRWKVGDRVLAPWEPQFLYVGWVTEIEGGRALIRFEDGDAGWVQLDQIRPLAIQRGQKVLCRRNMGPTFYPGEIIEVHGDQVCVLLEDGHEERTPIAGLRIPCQVLGPGAQPTTVASHLKFYERLAPGDRVWAPWQSATLFAGTVDRIEGKEVHIHFDDGDRGWVLLEQLAPLEVPVGLRVMARWKMGGQYYPGVVDQVQGERIHIRYDDGDQEWTRAAALALPVQPFGPDARPTRTVARWSQWSPQLGCLIPIGLLLLSALLRGGCR